jgi:predicted O-methyltransferase YrrM
LRSYQKRLFNRYVAKKKITHNFFSINCYDWIDNLKNENIKNYLEIGAFEGLSILFLNKNFKPKKIHAVDTWKGSNEHGKETIFSEVIKNYKSNTKKLRNIKNFRMTSDDFFKKKNIKYDLIYIDGLHTKTQVNKDLINSLKLSKKKTIIICDDFFWKFDKKFTQNLPIAAIIPIIQKYNLKVIAVSNNQVFLKV